ncbi:MAG TPA: hypothetical protein VHL78_10535 [Actinomycetota bacterium]|nr:hypothetical protein [Actinomycetota bacterium]
MATPATHLDEDYGLVLARYLRGLARNGGHRTARRSPGHDVRTCPNCGARSDFALDPEGTWYRCASCGHYA